MNIRAAFMLGAALACVTPNVVAAQTAGEKISAAVEKDTTSMLAASRIRQLGDSARRAWEEYVLRSTTLQNADRASMAAELARVGRDTMIRAPYVAAFEITPTMSGAWFKSDSAQRIANIVLSFQTPSGGWSKHVDMMLEPRKPGQSYFSENVNWQYIATIDNGSTTTQLRFLELMHAAHADARYVKAYHHGLDYLFAAQFPNGCWPQVYPLQGGYHDAVTFNDDATLNVVRLFQRMVDGDVALATAAERQRASSAIHTALDCLIKSQVVVNGVKTVWGQQHDPLTLAPVAARSYELKSLVSKESATIVAYLMRIPAPNSRTVEAIHTAVNWFKANAIMGYAYDASQGYRAQTGAGPLWARMSEIETNRPIFSNRAGITLYDWNQLTDRRQGYAWYSDQPAEVLKRYPAWARKHPRSPNNG